MITIIHGDDIASSRTYYQELRKNLKHPSVFEGDKITTSDILQIFEGGGLFDNNKSICIERLLSDTKQGKDKEEIFSYLEKQSTHNIVLWEGKELTKKSISIFKNATVKTFKLPSSLFAFIDAIAPGNVASIKNFHEALTNTEVELIFVMMVRQLRLLIGLYGETLSPDTIDEIKRLAPWQRSKLKKQLSRFSYNELLSVYKKLYNIDLRQKSGLLTMSLTATIDFCLLDL